MELISKHKDRIIYLCKKYTVKTLCAFGSVLTSKFTPQSDVDLVVEFLSIDLLAYFDNYFNFKFELEKLLQRDIDLLEAQAIRNPILKESIDQTKILIYDQGSQGLAA